MGVACVGSAGCVCLVWDQLGGMACVGSAGGVTCMCGISSYMYVCVHPYVHSYACVCMCMCEDKPFAGTNGRMMHGKCVQVERVSLCVMSPQIS